MTTTKSINRLDITHTKDQVIIDVPVQFIDMFEDNIKKLNKRCKKYGVPAAEFSYGKTHIQIFEKGETAIKVALRTVTIDFHRITISGGWKIIGSVEKTMSEYNLINGKIDDIEKLKKFDLSICDHCGTKRKRKKMIVFKSDSGEYRIVGSSCLKEYIGVSEDAYLFSNGIGKLLSCYLGDSEGDYEVAVFERLPHYYDFQDVVATTVGVLRKDKWQFHSAKYDDYSTGQQVMTHLIYSSDNKIKEHYLTEENYELADRFISELKAENPITDLETITDNFKYNFCLLLNTECVDYKHMKLFVGMMGYQITQRMKADKNVNKKDPKNSNYFGKIGEKFENVELVIEGSRICQSFYGDSLMIFGYFGDSEDKFVSFLSGHTGWLENEDGELKDRVMAAFTVKDHNDKGYGKTTTLTRVRAPKTKKKNKK